MERRASDSEKRSSQVKLPLIQHRKGESSRVLSNTMPDNCRLRPSSMHKVEDLEKKLFDKLDAYDNPTRKGVRRGTKKKVEGQNFGEQQIQGYERLQKMMPGLYTKLVEVKKTIVADPLAPPQPDLFSTQPRTSQAPSTAQLPSRKLSKELVKQPSKQADEADPLDLSPQQFQQVYRQYSRRQQLPAETSEHELVAMGQSLVVCQREITELTRSMQGLIRELGQECLLLSEQEQL